MRKRTKIEALLRRRRLKAMAASTWTGSQEQREYQRLYYIANKARKQAVAREYRRTHKDQESERSRQYKSQNRDRVRAASRAYSRTEKNKATKRAWASNNKDKIRERYRRYWAKIGRERPDLKKKIIQKAKERTAKVKDFIIELKNVPCFDCGARYPYYVMDFDHLRDKKSMLSKMGAASLSKVLDEAKKCQVVCANCHRARSWLRKKSNIVITKAKASEPKPRPRSGDATTTNRQIALWPSEAPACPT